ncbi:hypothetical protein [Vibrio sp. TRT 2004]|uniref:hypothetical protein n=1 Tax=Vibrio sp. TRT 2004 TaxID=3418506 RepID=UPI003CEE7790
MNKQDDKWDTTAIYGVLWCCVVILFFKGDYLLAILSSFAYTSVVSLNSVLQPVRKKYPYFIMCVVTSFIYVWGIVYVFQLLEIRNLWRMLATLPLIFLMYWFGTRKVRPLLTERKES